MTTEYQADTATQTDSRHAPSPKSQPKRNPLPYVLAVIGVAAIVAIGFGVVASSSTPEAGSRLQDLAGGGEAEIDLPVLDDPAEVVAAHIEEVGLDICSDDETGSDISGAYAGHYWAVGARCSDDGDNDGLVSLNLYNDPNTAAAQLQVPAGDAYITWLIDPTTVASVTEASTPQVVAAMVQVLSDYPSAGPGA